MHTPKKVTEAKTCIDNVASSKMNSANTVSTIWHLTGPNLAALFDALLFVKQGYRVRRKRDTEKVCGGEAPYV